MEFQKPVQILSGSTPLLTVEEDSLEVSSGDNPVYTTALGLAGFSDGAEEAKVTMSGAVPASGMEVNWAALCLAHVTTELTFKYATVSYTMKGRLLSAKTASPAKNPMKWDISFHGRVTSVSAV